MRELVQLFCEPGEEDANWQMFGDWINSLFDGGRLQIRPDVQCRHNGDSGLKPHDRVPCGIPQGVDKKGAAIRFSTIKRNAIDFLRAPRSSRRAQEPGSDSSETSRTTSTRMRVAHLAVLKAAADISVRDLELAYFKLRSNDFMVLHNCGCGSAGCCEPTHLRFGTREENNTDRSFHDVLRAEDVQSQPQLYFGFIDWYRQTTSARHLF